MYCCTDSSPRYSRLLPGLHSRSGLRASTLKNCRFFLPSDVARVKQASHRAALRFDAALCGRRTQSSAGPGDARPVDALLGGLGRAAGGQVFRGVCRRLPGAVGLLLHELFLGRGDDVAHRRGEE